MKKEALETLKKGEVYVLSPNAKGAYNERTYLLRNGELVFDCICTSSPNVVMVWKERDGDIYLGIGVGHK